MFWDEWTKPVKLHGTARRNSCQIQHTSQLTMNSDDTTPPISRWDIAQRIVDVLALRPCTLDRVGRFQLGDVEFWSKFFSQFSHCYIIIIDSSSLKGGLENTRPDRLGRSCCFFFFLGAKSNLGNGGNLKSPDWSTMSSLRSSEAPMLIGHKERWRHNVSDFFVCGRLSFCPICPLRNAQGHIFARKKWCPTITSRHFKQKN